MPKSISIEQFCSRNKVLYHTSEYMAEEQKRYINYFAERVNADDLVKRAMKLVLQDFLNKQKEYDVRLSKLDAVLSDVEKQAATYHSIIRTVKIQGRSAWEYLGKFFTKIFNGCSFFSVCDLTNFRANECRAKLI